MKKIILDLCGGTGAWSAPYKKAGYDVYVIDIKYGDDIRTMANEILIAPLKANTYGILAAPPCTEFSFAKTTGKPRNLRTGMEIVNACLRVIWEYQYQLYSPYAKTTPLKFWALENPNGLLKHFLGKPAFEFNPYDFGDPYQKHTHLWGWFNLPKKTPVKLTQKQKKLHKTNSQPLPRYMKFDRLKTKEIAPDYYGKYDRQTRRAITPPGFAQAFFEVNR